MAQNKKQIWQVYVPYPYILALSGAERHELLEIDNVELLTYISAEDEKLLSQEDAAKLEGFARIEKKPPVVKVPKFKPEELFARGLAQPEVSQLTYRQKHRQLPRPYAPRKMLNKGYNSKKRGGR